MYDSGLKDVNTLNKINTTIELISKEHIAKCIVFYPLCIEECALTFKRIKSDIKGLSSSQVKLLDSAYNFLKTGNMFNFIDYDIQTSKYKLCGIDIQNITNSKLIKGYTNISTIERCLADKLAEITKGKPYRFIKSANECWYSNCSCPGYECNYEKIIGSHRLNSPIAACNKTCLGKEKIECVIKESMFGIIYECIIYLLSSEKRNIINESIIKEYTKSYLW